MRGKEGQMQAGSSPEEKGGTSSGDEQTYENTITV
jgi:hypothetical protein